MKNYGHEVGKQLTYPSGLALKEPVNIEDVECVLPCLYSIVSLQWIYEANRYSEGSSGLLLAEMNCPSASCRGLVVLDINVSLQSPKAKHSWPTQNIPEWLDNSYIWFPDKTRHSYTQGTFFNSPIKPRKIPWPGESSNRRPVCPS